MAEEVIGKERIAAAKARGTLVADCTLALTTMGFSKTEAKAAAQGLNIEPDESLEEVVRAALQAVARPRV